MHPFKIAGIDISSPFVLAPMAGYSDYALRQLSADYGAGLVYTEMESSEALVYNSKPTIQDLKDTNLDKSYRPKTKLALQIFGGKKDIILRSIPLVEQYADYDFLDFNCGCPVPKVIRQQAGSYWLKRQEELIDLMRDVVKISSKPVIIKMRIGFDYIIDMPTLCLKLQNVGVQAFAIHARTRSEYFTGKPHYEVIKDIKNKVSVPVIANGSINASNYHEVHELTNCDGIMIGQDALGYPKIFEDLNRLEKKQKIKDVTLASQIQDLRKHLDLIYSFKSEKNASDIMRSYSVKYIKGFDNAKRYRSLLVHAAKKEDYLRILNEIEKSFLE